ncbi:hypothetical protein [Algoriphagus boritolerans]
MTALAEDADLKRAVTASAMESALEGLVVFRSQWINREKSRTTE